MPWRNIMMVVLGYFLIATLAAILASAIMGLVLTNLLIAGFEKADRVIRIASKFEVNTLRFLRPHALFRKILVGKA
jgi:hypothetical protein